MARLLSFFCKSFIIQGMIIVWQTKPSHSIHKKYCTFKSRLKGVKGSHYSIPLVNSLSLHNSFEFLFITLHRETQLIWLPESSRIGENKCWSTLIWTYSGWLIQVWAFLTPQQWTYNQSYGKNFNILLYAWTVSEFWCNMRHKTSLTVL